MCVCDTSWSEYNNIVGLANLRKEFNVCSLQANQVSSCSKCVITSGVSIILIQIDHLVGWVKNSFTSLAMMDYPYPTSFLAPLPAFPVREACHLLLQYPNTVTGLAKAAGQPFHLHVYSTSHFCYCSIVLQWIVQRFFVFRHFHSVCQLCWSHWLWNWTQFISMGLSGAWRKLICCLHYCCLL